MPVVCTGERSSVVRITKLPLFGDDKVNIPGQLTHNVQTNQLLLCPQYFVWKYCVNFVNVHRCRGFTEINKSQTFLVLRTCLLFLGVGIFMAMINVSGFESRCYFINKSYLTLLWYLTIIINIILFIFWLK